VIHEPLELFRREEFLEFGVNSVHALHVLRTSKTFLPETGILEMHTINRIDTNRVRDTQLTRQTRRLRQRFLLRSTLWTSLNRLLSP